MLLSSAVLAALPTVAAMPVGKAVSQDPSWHHTMTTRALCLETV